MSGSGSPVQGPVTSRLADSDVLLVQMPTIGHTDMTRPDRARLKENKSANSCHDGHGIDV